MSKFGKTIFRKIFPGERVSNLNDLTLNKFMKQTVKTDKVGSVKNVVPP